MQSAPPKGGAFSVSIRIFAHMEQVFNLTTDKKLKAIAEKVIATERINNEEGLMLYQADLAFVGALANYIREEKHDSNTYFNRNFHIEPTNICVFDCKFCSYSRLLKQKDGQWELTADQMFDIVKSYDGSL